MASASDVLGLTSMVAWASGHGCVLSAKKIRWRTALGTDECPFQRGNLLALFLGRKSLAPGPISSTLPLRDVLLQGPAILSKYRPKSWWRNRNSCRASRAAGSGRARERVSQRLRIAILYGESSCLHNCTLTLRQNRAAGTRAGAPAPHGFKQRDGVRRRAWFSVPRAAAQFGLPFRARRCGRRGCHRQ